jgi:hypothetical protein
VLVTAFLISPLDYMKKIGRIIVPFLIAFQVTSFFAPSSRFGTPDELRYISYILGLTDRLAYEFDLKVSRLISFDPFL